MPDRFPFTQISFAVVLVYLATGVLYFARLQKRRLERLTRFRGALKNGFENPTIEKLEDLINVYKGIYALAGEDDSYKSDLARQLRRQIAALAVGGTEIQDSAVGALKRTLTDYLHQIEAENPYAGLPSAERTVLQDIKEMIRVRAFDGAFRKLDDLAGLVQVRQDSLDKLTSLNRWSTPLAVIGLILTVVFGLMSLKK